MVMSRRVLVHPDRVHAVFAKMRDELAELGERHAAEVGRLHRELAALRAELEGVRSAFDELRSVGLARSKAEIEVASLRRLQAIGRAQAVTRDPALPLN
jgi:hypothetical protein